MIKCNGIPIECSLLIVFSLVFIIGYAAEWAVVEESSTCRTPQGIEGTCQNIRHCEPMMDYLATLTTGISIETTLLLKKYHCGFEGRDPKVCCPPTQELLVEEAPDVSKHRNLHLLSEDCGFLGTDDRIVNGNKTGIFEFPWMALLSYGLTNGQAFLCGGTVITDRYILTAAHCVTGLKHPLVGVRVGEHDIRTREDCELHGTLRTCAPPFQDLAIDEVIVHPNYNITALRNDIALIRVSGKMNFAQENIRPICLPLDRTRNYNFTNRYVLVTGWGTTETGKPSPDLLKVEIPFVPLDQCRQDYQQIAGIKITQKQLCAGGRNRMDSCAGDSGGPLQVVARQRADPAEDMKYVQQGIVSFGPKFCGTDNHPGIYTRVAYYMDWILDNLRA